MFCDARSFSQCSERNTDKSVFSLVNSAVNRALPAFAAERRAAAPLLLDASRCRSTYPARTALSSKPSGRRMMELTDGRTPDRDIDLAPHTDHFGTVIVTHY